MVQVMIRLLARPHCAAKMIQAFRTLMLPLPAKRGFVSCGLYFDAYETGTIVYMEEWQKAEALDQQIQSTHYTRLLQLMEEAVGPPDLRINWITGLKGLDYVQAVRSASADSA